MFPRFMSRSMSLPTPPLTTHVINHAPVVAGYAGLHGLPVGAYAGLHGLPVGAYTGLHGLPLAVAASPITVAEE